MRRKEKKREVVAVRRSRGRKNERKKRRCKIGEEKTKIGDKKEERK